MPRLQNTFKCGFAAFMFFTRLPLSSLIKVGKKEYEGVVPFWPLVGWLTGGLMSLVTWGALQLGISDYIAILLAMITRILLTGALHEDGLADFCDGFGGGHTKESTLTIMKDSHIGSYGVLSLILYSILYWSCLHLLISQGWSPLIFLIVDPLSKWMVSTIVYFLPYARTEQEAKNKLIYKKTPILMKIFSLIMGITPLILSICLSISNLPDFSSWLLILPPPILGTGLLFYLMHRRIKGYTGDCCGACFLLTELLFYISLCFILS